MPRQPKLRIKNGSWATNANGGKCFGPCSTVSKTKATKLFHEFMATANTPTIIASNTLTVDSLCDGYLYWVSKNRSSATLKNNTYNLNRFCNFKIDGERIGDMLADKITVSIIKNFLSTIVSNDDNKNKIRKTSIFFSNKILTTIKTCWNWSTKKDGFGTKYEVKENIPRTISPTTLPEHERSIITQEDLITKEELDLILRVAGCNLSPIKSASGQWTTPTLDQVKPDDDYMVFLDLVKCYRDTGSRPGELITATVGEFDFANKQLIKTRHKRMNTQSKYRPRTIILLGDSFSIIENRCKNKSKNDLIFPCWTGKQFTTDQIDKRFATIRQICNLRNDITIYNFRHTLITRLLNNNMKIQNVAKLAGTSIDMIMRTYEHVCSSTIFNEASAAFDKL